MALLKFKKHKCIRWTSYLCVTFTSRLLWHHRWLPVGWWPLTHGGSLYLERRPSGKVTLVMNQQRVQATLNAGRASRRVFLNTLGRRTGQALWGRAGIELMLDLFPASSGGNDCNVNATAMTINWRQGEKKNLLFTSVLSLAISNSLVGITWFTRTGDSSRKKQKKTKPINLRSLFGFHCLPCWLQRSRACGPLRVTVWVKFEMIWISLFLKQKHSSVNIDTESRTPAP